MAAVIHKAPSANPNPTTLPGTIHVDQLLYSTNPMGSISIHYEIDPLQGAAFDISTGLTQRVDLPAMLTPVPTDPQHNLKIARLPSGNPFIVRVDETIIDSSGSPTVTGFTVNVK